MMLMCKLNVPIESVDLSQPQKSPSDDVTKVLTVEIWSYHKTAAFRIEEEFGLTACPLYRPPGAQGVLKLIIQSF